MINSDVPFLCCNVCRFTIAESKDVIKEVYPDYLKAKTFVYNLDIL